MPRGEQFLRFYPGLIAVEERLWRRWLRDHESEWDRFEYNVRVGEGVTARITTQTGDPGLDARLEEQYRNATKKRIDVVGSRLGETWIFEIEERPSTRALGQLYTYRQLLAKERGIVGEILLGLVCVRLGPDMAEAFTDAGAFIWQLGPEDLRGPIA